MAPEPPILDAGARRFSWLDVLWLLFLGGLAVLPPRWEWHKQLTLLAIGIVQLLEGCLIGRLPKRILMHRQYLVIGDEIQFKVIHLREVVAKQ